MENNRASKRKILLKAYMRIALVNMISLMASNVLGAIDNAIISRNLGNGALAAIGYFSPVSTISSLAFILIVGTSIMCGNFIGSGQQQKVNSLFTGTFIVLAVVCASIAFAVILFRVPLGSILGAKGDAYTMLLGYMLGFSPSILFSALGSFLLSLTVFNNEINKTYFATAAMFVVHVLFAVILIKPLGTFGIGLSTTISSIAFFIILIPIFMKKNSTIHFEKRPIDWMLIIEAAKRGSPSLFFMLGMFTKTSLMNYTLMTHAGDAGIAVVNVMNSICGILGTIIMGYVNSHLSMGSLTFGEEDREGYIDLFNIAQRISVVSCFIVISAMAICSGRIADLYFEKGSEAYEIGRVMFIIGFWYNILSVWINFLMNSYKIQGRLWLVNFISVAETAAVGIFAVITVPLFGVNAAWLANLFSDILMALIIVISVFNWKKRFSLSAASLLKIPDSFGATKEEYVEYSVRNINDVSAVSASVIDFCKARGEDRKKAFWVGLCVEEMARNIFQHGHFHDKLSHVSVRVVCTNELTVRISDDCIKFDPRQRMEMYNPETPEKNIGLRTVARLAQKIDYYNNAGINTLIMKI